VDFPTVKWDRLFAKRTELMRRSAIRELLKVAARPEIISFAGGLPASELFPMERVKEALASVVDRVGPRSLQYSETEGLPELREWIAREFSPCRGPGDESIPELTVDCGLGTVDSNRGLVTSSPTISAENVLITSGAQQALDLVGRVLLDEGDTVVVENPTYLALLSAWRPLGVRFVPIGSDANGMRVDELPGIIGRHRPKLVYLTPNFQNPQGTTLSLERRLTIMAVLREHGIPVLEDNPYGELRYEGESLPHLLSLDGCRTRPGPDHVIYTGSFSKVLMPGLRVGWIIAANEVIEKLLQAKQAADLQTSTLSQHLVLELLSRGVREEMLPVLLKNYRKRRDAMLSALERYFPSDCTWTRPEGGMFLMLKLAGLDARELLPEALRRGVAFVPGEEFHLNGEGKETMRLNFSNSSPDRIDQGIKRLATS